jgi:hypothetical protein
VRTARPDLAVGLLALVLAAVLAVALLLDGPSSDGPTWSGMVLALTAVYGGAGAVLAWAGAAPVVRRVLLGIGLTCGLGGLASAYAGPALGPASDRPGAELALWLASWLWSPAYVAVPAVLPLVLPDGRLVWPWTRWLAGAAVAVTALSWALTPYHLQDVPIEGHVNPVGVDAAAHPLAVAGVIALVLTAVAVAVASLVVRQRRAEGVARDQLRWLLLGVLGTVAVGGSAFVLPDAAAELVPALAVVPFPAACVVALLRHRLWDVDLVLSRSLSYGLLSATAVGAYVVAVALVGGLVGSTVGAPVLATALVALLVVPLHARLDRLVNRLVHGDADDPYTALARLGDRLEATADPVAVADQVLPDLVTSVARALRVPHVAVVLADGSTTEAGEPSGQERVDAAAVRRGRGRRAARRRGPAAAPRAPPARAPGPPGGRRGARRARRAGGPARPRRHRDRPRGGAPPPAPRPARRHGSGAGRGRAAGRDRPRPRAQRSAGRRGAARPARPPAQRGGGRRAGPRPRPPAADARRAGPGGIGARAGDPLQHPDPPGGRVVGRARAAAGGGRPRRLPDRQRRAGQRRQARGASRVHLVLEQCAGALQVRVSDDGVGVPETMTPGVGLRSMRERAEELGGSCSVVPGQGGRGTTVLATIPVQREG